MHGCMRSARATAVQARRWAKPERLRPRPTNVRPLTRMRSVLDAYMGVLDPITKVRARPAAGEEGGALDKTAWPRGSCPTTCSARLRAP